jgi:hypothetical protein
MARSWPITGNLDTEAIFLRFWQNPPHTGSQSIQVPYLENAGGIRSRTSGSELGSQMQPPAFP